MSAGCTLPCDGHASIAWPFLLWRNLRDLLSALNFRPSQNTAKHVRQTENSPDGFFVGQLETLRPRENLHTLEVCGPDDAGQAVAPFAAAALRFHATGCGPAGCLSASAVPKRSAMYSRNSSWNCGHLACVERCFMSWLPSTSCLTDSASASMASIPAASICSRKLNTIAAAVSSPVHLVSNPWQTIWTMWGTSCMASGTGSGAGGLGAWF